jgi:hypothetical protein
MGQGGDPAPGRPQGGGADIRHARDHARARHPDVKRDMRHCSPLARERGRAGRSVLPVLQSTRLWQPQKRLRTELLVCAMSDVAMRAKHTVAVDYVGELLRNRGLMASYSEIACAADLAILRERCGSDRTLCANRRCLRRSRNRGHRWGDRRSRGSTYQDHRGQPVRVSQVRQVGKGSSPPPCAAASA